jgi:uncharacterized protein YnzC (UPF0291/DUF896 family)
MGATYKKIYNKPAVTDIWFFEKDFTDISIFNDNVIDTMTKFYSSEYTGFVNYELTETITFEELDLRKEELKTIRPDLYNLLYEIEVVDPSDSTTANLIELTKKHNMPPPWHPFLTVWTEVINFDTWENLINSYEEVIQGITEGTRNELKENLLKFNNTLTEEFYIDGVKQNYIGKLTS